MSTSPKIICLVAGFALLWTAPANAQTPTPAMRATLQAQHASGIRGSVSAAPQGAGTKVQVTFSTPLATSKALTLMSGEQCTDVLHESATTIALNPPQGRVSSTIVAIPFSAFSSRTYVVDIRNATANANQAEACARI